MRPAVGTRPVSMPSTPGGRPWAPRPCLPPRRNPFPRAWVIYALSVMTYATVFALWQVEPIPLDVHAADILLAAVCLFPLALWYARGSPGAPMFELICLAYLVQYGTPVYLQPNSFLVFSHVVPFTWNETLQTELLVVVGVGTMIAAYYATQASGLTGRLPRIDLPLDARRRPQFLAVAIAFGLAISGLQLVHLAPDNGGPLGALVRLCAAQYTIAIVILAYRVYRRPSGGASGKFLLFAAVTVSVLLGLASGFLEPALTPLVLLFLARWHITRRVPLVWVIAGFVAFVLLQSVKADYRAATWQGNPGFVARLALWGELPQQTIQTMLDGDVAANMQTLVRRATARFDTFHVFEWVHLQTPATVGYYGGSSYAYFLYGWIPRAVWPDKPIAQAGQIQFEQDYQLLAPSQLNGATIGIGHLGEAYANFGVVGIAVVLALQGSFFALFGAALDAAESDGGRAIYLAIMVTFLNGIGSMTTTLFGAILQNALASALVLRLFATSWRTDGGRTWGRRCAARLARRP